jgi:hypothetical protein
MTRDINPLQSEDIPELGRFLAEGFHADPGAEFAAPDVLRWKYLEPRWPGDDGPRSFVAREGGRIVGHVGFCPTAFRMAGSAGREVTTLHMIDWLGSEGHPGVGSSLMRQAHRHAETQYGFGGSVAGRRVIRGGGYELAAEVPVFQKVLRVGHRLREAGAGPLRKVVRAARDIARGVRQRARGPAEAGRLRRVEAFGPEVAEILDGGAGPLVFTDRRPGLLNYFLRYPRGGLTGWLLEGEGRVRGFALLNVIPRGGVRVGKVVDCFLDTRDSAPWHAAFWGLAEELRGLGADVALACGSTPWAADGLRAAGFHRLHVLDFSLRDRGGLVPRDAPFHLSFLEADYAYT